MSYIDLRPNEYVIICYDKSRRFPVTVTATRYQLGHCLVLRQPKLFQRSITHLHPTKWIWTFRSYIVRSYALVHFCDARFVAYSTVIHSRKRLEDRAASVLSLATHMRVCPLKNKVTIGPLEPSTAITAIRTVHKINTELRSDVL